MKAILTGHSRGLGAAIGAELLSRGIPVLGLARSGNADLQKRFPDKLQQQALDLSDCAGVAQWLASDVLRHFLAGCKSVLLINNAGVVEPVGALQVQDPAAIARAVALNVATPLMLSAAVVAASGDATERRVLHVSSGAARKAYPGWSVYCATKAALDHHARSVMLDQTPALRVCSLAPGVIDTDMQALIRATPLERFPIRGRFEAMKRDGTLVSPQAGARALVDYLLDDRFGEEPVADLRG